MRSRASVKSALLHPLVPAPGGQQRGLVGEIGQVGAHHPRRRGGERVEVDVVGERNRAGMDAQDRRPARGVGRLHRHPSVEAAGPQQRRVEHVGPVGGADDHHLVAGVEPVHLGEDLVEGLLALVVAAEAGPAAAAGAPDGIELVDEDDRRRGLLGLLEEVAHARGADAHDRLDELRGRGREEGHARLAGHGTREQRLAGAGRARQQDPSRDAGAELAVTLGIAQEVHHLGQLGLGLVDAGHVCERDRLRLRLHPPGAAAAELARASPHRPALCAARRKSQMKMATSRMVGPKLNRIVSSRERSPGGLALTTTSFSSSRLASSSSLAKVGTWVSKFCAFSPS